MNTYLDYLVNSKLYQIDATILDSFSEDGCFCFIPNHTVFYPGGGGQPQDCGRVIFSPSETYEIKSTSWKDLGLIHKTNAPAGYAFVSGICTISIDPDQREANSQLQTAGHIIFGAVEDLFPGQFNPVKAFHYPDGPYIEFEGDKMYLTANLEKLQTTIKEIIKSPLPVTIHTNENSAFTEAYYGIKRFIKIGEQHSVACGGTHCSFTNEIKDIHILKIKNKGVNFRLSYTIDL